MTLFKQYFRVQRSGLIIWAGSSGFLAWALAVTAKPLELGGSLASLIEKLADKLPAGIRGLFAMAPGLSPIDSLIQAKLGFWMTLALPIYGCLLAVSAVNREIDRGTADFLLALPVERRQVLVARWGVMALNLGAVALVTWATLSVGLVMNHVIGRFSGYFWMIAQGWLLGLAVGSLAMLGSMWAQGYEQAVKWSLGAVGVLFSVDLGMRVASISRSVRFLNPFSYFDSVEPLLRNSLIWGDAVVLLATSLISLWLAVRVFQSKQIVA